MAVGEAELAEPGGGGAGGFVQLGGGALWLLASQPPLYTEPHLCLANLPPSSFRSYLKINKEINHFLLFSDLQEKAEMLPDSMYKAGTGYIVKSGAGGNWETRDII